jgi:hypothetical protein
VAAHAEGAAEVTVEELDLLGVAVNAKAAGGRAGEEAAHPGVRDDIDHRV